MAERSDYTYEREVRDTVIKSSLTGVAATVLAVTIFSPAGFGGMIGTSLASGFGLDPNVAPADDSPYANLPAYPAPLTQDEISDIRGQLARTTASLEITRAATEARIDHIRSIAVTSDGLVTFTPAPQQTAEAEALRLETTPPSAIATPAPAEAAYTPASYSGGGGDVQFRDPHLELAELMFAHENF
jgi:hypothetical protein